MSLSVFLAVMLAAAMHAGWNTLVKQRADGLLTIILVMSGAGVFALPLLFAFPAPDNMTAWGLLAVSVLVHLGYNIGLGRAYGAGDMGQVYPLARGTAPLLAAVVSALWLGEVLSTPTYAAISTLSAGIMLMAWRGGSGNPGSGAVRLALITSAFIAGYTLLDGWGGRLSPSSIGFACWLFVIEGLVMLAIAPVLEGRGTYLRLAKRWRTGLIGGGLSFAAYAIVIWAMAQAPIAAVAALRESSILFALLLSSLVLGERVSRWRMLSGALILAGVIGLRLFG